MKGQEVMMNSPVKYVHINPLKEPNKPCADGCTAYRLRGLMHFKGSVEVIFDGILEDGRVNHQHCGAVSPEEAAQLYEFGEQMMSSDDFCLLDLAVGWHVVRWPVFPPIH